MVASRIRRVRGVLISTVPGARHGALLRSPEAPMLPFRYLREVPVGRLQSCNLDNHTNYTLNRKWSSGFTRGPKTCVEAPYREGIVVVLSGL